VCVFHRDTRMAVAYPKKKQPARIAESSADILEPGIKRVPPNEVHYKLMRLLQSNPGMSQRDAARELGISLGKVNYCLQALMQKGWIKSTNFKNSQNKAAYMYLLTPRGLQQKALLTLHFLQIKMREYETLNAEIGQLRRETEGHVAAADKSTQPDAAGK
jgi:EPS-associated MarR family transcriptional regulator